MQTKMTCKDKTRYFISQQYQVGLYVAVHDRLDAPPLEQMNLDAVEADFHADLRAGKVMKRGWKYTEDKCAS